MTKYQEQLAHVEVLAHLWLQRFEYADRNEQKAKPEYNMEGTAACVLAARSESMLSVGGICKNKEFVAGQGIGFELGVAFAVALLQNGMPDPKLLRAALEEADSYLVDHCGSEAA